MEHYLEESTTYRSQLAEPDVTLELLRQVLFAFLGANESQSDEDLDRKLKAANPIGERLPQLTQEEAQAWHAAGMPSPLPGWLKDYRERRRCGSQANSGS